MMDLELLNADFESLEALFAELEIATDRPGFYDHPNFVAQEQRNPEFLSLYARFVSVRPMTDEYVENARRVVPIVSAILHQELVEEGRLGACVDMSMVLSRVLEKLGIWNFMVRGSLTMSFPSHLGIQPIYFWSEAETPDPGHVWVCAPPFDVVDLTLAQQPYPSRKVADRVPATVVAQGMQVAQARSVDLYSPMRRARAEAKGHDALSEAPAARRAFVASFSARTARIGGATVKYVPFAASAGDAPLEGIKNQRWNGRFGQAIYDELIAPAMES